MENGIAVSVVCNAYNHEKYIAQTIESFVMQKTNFKFEILMHDDASTDKTADIIREYEAKYPELIKPIYQTENQYSKRNGIIPKLQFGRAQGKYIAFCEGDDYWTDPYKLQKQFDAMEKNPSADLCAHSTTKLDAKTNTILSPDIRPAKKNKIIKVEDVILGGGGFVATNSLFFRAEINKNVPEFRKFLLLDYTLQIFASLRGGMVYLDECMSVYRVMTGGSWTINVGLNLEKRAEHDAKIIRMLEILDEETNYKYSKVIKKKILENRSGSVYRKVLRKEALEKSDYEVIKKASLSYKIKILLYLYLPNVMAKIRK